MRGEPLVAVGVPLPRERAAYFEVYRLDDIDESLRSLGLTLLVATSLTTVVAGALGYWASRYTLRPINRIGDAAEAVALGQLDTRLDYAEYAHDADLAPLVANFNGMVSALEERIDRDARFASDVSHELRSPLTTLNAGIKVLANARDEMPERAQVALDLLSLDVERFTQLVEDLLEISRFDAGAVRLELDEVAHRSAGADDGRQPDPRRGRGRIGSPTRRRRHRVRQAAARSHPRQLPEQRREVRRRIDRGVRRTGRTRGRRSVGVRPRFASASRTAGRVFRRPSERASSTGSTAVTRAELAAPMSVSDWGSPSRPSTPGSRAARSGSRIAMTAVRALVSSSSCR